MSGRLIGVGTGPGDPELLTLKAVRALGEADVVAHFAKAGHCGNARATAAGFLRPGVIELPLLYPVTTEVAKHEPAYGAAIDGFFAEAAASVEGHLAAGCNVAVLSEGDPLFYGSFMHLHVRLAPRWPVEVIPGVTAMSGGWSQAGLPLAQGDVRSVAEDVRGRRHGLARLGGHLLRPARPEADHVEPPAHRRASQPGTSTSEK